MKNSKLKEFFRVSWKQKAFGFSTFFHFFIKMFGNWYLGAIITWYWLKSSLWFSCFSVSKVGQWSDGKKNQTHFIRVSLKSRFRLGNELSRRILSENMPFINILQSVFVTPRLRRLLLKTLRMHFRMKLRMHF